MLVGEEGSVPYPSGGGVSPAVLVCSCLDTSSCLCIGRVGVRYRYVLLGGVVSTIIICYQSS